MAGKSRHINIHSWSYGVHAGTGWKTSAGQNGQRKDRLVNRGTHAQSRVYACLNGLCFRQVRALHQRSTQESERYSFQYWRFSGKPVCEIWPAREKNPEEHQSRRWV